MGWLKKTIFFKINSKKTGKSLYFLFYIIFNNEMMEKKKEFILHDESQREGKGRLKSLSKKNMRNMKNNTTSGGKKLKEKEVEKRDQENIENFNKKKKKIHDAILMPPPSMPHVLCV